MKLRILALAVCIICSINLIGQEQFDRLYRTSQRVMTSLDMVEQEGGGTYFLLSSYIKETQRDTTEGLNVTSLDKKGSVNWSRDYIFYEDSSAVEAIGSIVITEDGLMINAVVIDTLAELSNVVIGLDANGVMEYARAYGSNSEDILVSGNAILSNALEEDEIFHFGNTMTADGLGIYASKIDKEGALIWGADLQAKDTLDNSFEEEIVDIEISFDDSYLAVGSLNNESIFVLNHDENGAQKYSRSYSTFGAFNTEASGAATFEDSTTVLSAYLTSFNGNTSGGLIKIDTIGNIIWSKQLAATLGLGTIRINDIVAGDNGQIAIAGNIDGADVIGAVADGEFIVVLDSEGTVLVQQQYQIIEGKGSLRSGSLTHTEDGGYAYLTTAFDEEAGKDSLVMRMIKVNEMGDLGILESGQNCNTILVGLIVNDLAFRQDTLVWQATTVETMADTIEVFDFNYSHQAPILTLQDSMFCPGDPVAFEFDATTPGAVSYRWYKADEEDMTLSTDSVYVGTEIDVDYVAEVKIELDNCFTLCDTSRLTEIMPPMISIGKGFGNICPDDGGEVLLILSGAGGNPIAWATNPTQNTDIIAVTEPGNYSVSVTSQCEVVTSSISVSEDDFYQPITDVTLNKGECSNRRVVLSFTSDKEASSIMWSTGATSNSITVLNGDEGTYTVTVTDVCGTTVSDEIEVLREDVSCFEGTCQEGSTNAENGCLCWPNAFIPQSEEETNKNFGPVDQCPGSISNYNLRIYNRWGEKVFESDAVGTEWNGRKGSKDQPSAVYAYYVVYEVDGLSVKDKGHVTLIR